MKFKVSVPKFIFSTNPTIRVAWCEEHIGERNELWSIRSDPEDKDDMKITYFFVNDEDATLFALRWAGVEM